MRTLPPARGSTGQGIKPWRGEDHATDEASRLATLYAQAEESQRDAIFAQLYPLLSPAVLLAVCGFDVPGYDTDDLQQEAMLRLAAAMLNYDPSKGSAKHFAFVVATRRATDLHRHARTRRRRCLAVSIDTEDRAHDRLSAMAAAGPCPAQAAEEADEPPGPDRHLREPLMETECRVLSLMLQGCTPSEIAGELGLSRWGVYSAIRRIRSKAGDRALK